MSAQLRVLVTAAIICCHTCPVIAEDSWTVSRVLNLIEAREQAIVNLEANLEVSQVMPEGQRKYFERKLEASKLIAEAQGLTMPPPLPGEDGTYAVPAPFRVRYVRGTGGLERIERVGQDAGEGVKMPSITYTYDWEYW